MTGVQPFRLGVNYWPARYAMRFWRNWKRGELRRDFSQIRQTGFDSVRLFLLWEDFQPSPGAVDNKMLDLLKATLDIAEEADLVVMPTLYTGHMSGTNWFPGWAVRRARDRQRFPVVCGGRVVEAESLDWFGDEKIRAAQIKLASECATALAGHPSLFAWDLGNENSNCVVARDRDSGRAWLHSIAETLRHKDSKTPVTIGLHMEDLEDDRGITPKEAAEVCDFLTMHGYPGYASFIDSPTDERLLPFLAQLTRFLGGGKEVLFSEFGVPTRPDLPASGRSATAGGDVGSKLVSEEEAADYVRRGLRALRQSGSTGAMLWCYSDYSSALLDVPPLDSAPHESSFGMFRSDGSPKPAAEAVRQFSQQRQTVAQWPRIKNESFIDLTHDDFYDAPERHLSRLFGRYCLALGEVDPFSE